MAIPNVYDTGDLVRVSAEFKDIAGTLTDTTVTLKWRAPGGAVQTWTVTAGEVVKDATGKYHADLNITVAGTWIYKFFGAGAVQAAEPGFFYAKANVLG